MEINSSHNHCCLFVVATGSQYLVSIFYSHFQWLILIINCEIFWPIENIFSTDTARDLQYYGAFWRLFRHSSWWGLLQTLRAWRWKGKNESFPGPIAFDLCGPRGAGQAIGALSQNWDFLFFNSKSAQVVCLHFFLSPWLWARQLLAWSMTK